MDFHPREDGTGYGSDLVLSDYFYPEHNLLLISARLQEREFAVPRVISGIRRIQDSAESMWESMLFKKLSGLLRKAPCALRIRLLRFHNSDHGDFQTFISHRREVAQPPSCPWLNGCSSQGNCHWSGGYRLLCLFLSMPLQRTRLFSLLTDWLFLLIQLLPCSSLFTDSFLSWIAFLWDSG